jgi:hypothetical protein
MKLINGRTMVGIGVILVLSLLMRAHLAQSASAPGGILGNVIVNNTTNNPALVQGVVNDSVLLYAATDSNGSWQPFRNMYQIFPDGSTATTPFEVPLGKVLVVTDINCAGNGVDAHALIGITISNLTDNTKRQDGPSVGFTFGPTIGSQSITQSFSTGFVVSDQAKIYPNFKTAGSGANKPFFQAWVTGYLRPAP